MSLVVRSFRSIRARGLPATLRSAWHHLESGASRLVDRRFDPRHGTETGIVVENAALGDVASPNLARGIRYEPTRALPFRQLLRTAAVPVRGTFVDIGCGKGRVLMLAAMHGFDRVTGVDYSPSLCAAARRNLDALQSAGGLRFEATVHATDAIHYVFQPGDAVVFLFNPFDDTVLRPVLEQLRASLAAQPRQLTLIYHNPAWRSVIEESGLFTTAQDYSFGGCNFAVYRTRG